MRTWVTPLCVATTLFTVALGSTVAMGRGPARRPSAAGSGGGFIVLYGRSVQNVKRETARHERAEGFKARFEYGHALKGFAARLSDRQVKALRADPRVAAVVPDRPVKALGSVPLAANEPTPPTGVRRIAAATTTTVRQASSVNVAVIDTGIDLTHPDLNAVSGTNCVRPGTAAQDDNGHGSHVSGTIAAKNNGAGVVGVAPSTKLYAVKVLDASGSGTQSQALCGMNWVTANAGSLNIKVANMSLGGSGNPLDSCPNTLDPEHKALCNSTAAGVTYAVAAGNSGWDFDYAPIPDVPAAYPEALTVTAITDSDGRSGGTGGAPTCTGGQVDDRYASFSNYAATAGGRSHTIAGPGVCIRSTWMGGGYNTISGTSMATPHLAGAVALCLGEAGASGPCTGLSPAQIVQKMRTDAASQTTATPSYGFTGDPVRPVSGRYFGYLDWSGTSQGPPPPPPPVTAAPTSTSVLTGTYRAGSAASLASADSSYYQVHSTTASSPFSTFWYGQFTGVPTTLSSLRVAFQGNHGRTCSQTISIYRFTDNTWVNLDTRNVGPSDVLVSNLAPAAPLSNYVSSTGTVRAAVRCDTTAGTFISSGNLLQLTYTP